MFLVGFSVYIAIKIEGAKPHVEWRLGFIQPSRKITSNNYEFWLYSLTMLEWLESKKNDKNSEGTAVRWTGIRSSDVLSHQSR